MWLTESNTRKTTMLLLNLNKAIIRSPKTCLATHHCDKKYDINLPEFSPEIFGSHHMNPKATQSLLEVVTVKENKALTT